MCNVAIRVVSWADKFYSICAGLSISYHIAWSPSDRASAHGDQAAEAQADLSRCWALMQSRRKCYTQAYIRLVMTRTCLHSHTVLLVMPGVKQGHLQTSVDRYQTSDQGLHCLPQFCFPFSITARLTGILYYIP